MATTKTALVIAHLRQWLSRSRPEPDTDAALLGRFAADRDETAFAALVDRHGPMVLGVARRVTGNHHTAEDVFQATFLTLARQAGRLRRPAALPAWLHQTASTIALMALRASKRRARAEAEAVSRGSCTPLDDLSSRELLAILDEELRQLPETFRLPLLLCCLEGRSQDEAAQILGWTPGSVKGRLERGRQRLRDRLAHRGLTFAVGAGVPLLVAPPSLAGPLREAALQAARDGVTSPAVTLLARGAVQPGLGVPWKTLLAVAAVGLVGVGIGLASRSVQPEQTAAPAEGPPLAEGKDPPAAPRGDPLGEPLPEGAVKRLGSSRLRIGNSAFAMTPDSRTIVTVSPEGIVREFDANTGWFLQRRRLGDRSDLHPSGECQVRLSANGKAAAIAEWCSEWIDDGRRITVWDVASGKRTYRHALAEQRYVTGFGLSADGNQLALTESIGNTQERLTLQIIDLQTGRAKGPWDLEPGSFGCEVRFTNDGKRVVVSQEGHQRTDASTFTCFDVSAGKQLWRLPRKGREWGLHGEEWGISPDGKTLVSAAQSGEAGFQIIETDPVSGQPTERFKADKEPTSGVGVLIAPDNRTVAIHRFNRILVWDLRTGEEVRRFKVKTIGVAIGPGLEALSPDGRSLLSNRGHLQRWDLASGKPYFELPPDDGLGDPVHRVAFAPGGKEVFAAGARLAAQWNVATGQRISISHQHGNRMVATPAGTRLVGPHMTDRRDRMQVVDLRIGKTLHTVLWDEPPELEVKDPRAYTLTQDGKTLLVGHMGQEKRGETRNYVTVCDVVSGRRLSRFIVPEGAVGECSFSPCGRWVVLGGKVYHTGTGTDLLPLSGKPDDQLVPPRGGEPRIWFSEDGRLLAGMPPRTRNEGAADTDALLVWELASGRVLARIPRGKHVGQAVFAPDRRTLALFDAQGVRLHDLLTGKQLASYPTPDVAYDRYAFSQGAQSLAFAPDGRTLATGHEDGSILLWQVPQPANAGQAPGGPQRETLWADLGSESPAKARAAVDRLARWPVAATALLKAKFRPASPDPDSVAALLKDLDSDVFATREEAERKLREQGARAEPELRRTLAGNPSPEVKRRIEVILEGNNRARFHLPLSGEDLRGVRAIEVLERAGTPEARTLLQAWAEQSRNPRLAAEARAARDRIH
jgi:RNA polymerase sigma factor (sigma-70 family)